MILIFQILATFIAFVVQTVFLTLALWIMIKVQKLDYNFPGLLGSAALACAVDNILNLALRPWFDGMSTYISAPFFLVVLYVCLKKLTNADHVDVIFTMCVGGALRFGMNLWLIGMLMGDLRPSARNSDEFETSAPQPETNEVQQIATRTNQPVQTAHQTAPGATAGLAAQPKPEQLVETATNLFSVKGVSRNGSKSAVTIQTGKRTYTISLGESALTQTSKGPVSVRFKELGDGWVVLTINGKETKLPFH